MSEGRPGPGRAKSQANSRVRGRLRGFVTVAKVLIGLTLLLGTSFGVALGAYRLALSSPQFALRSVSVDESRRSSNWALLRRAGLQRGENLLGLDLPAAEKRLASDPWIASARLTRRLPGHLHVELVEHEAVALASLHARVFLVNASGDPFKPLERGDPHDLPVLTGVTGLALAKDRPAAIGRFSSALAMLSHYGRLAVSRKYAAQEVNVSPDGTAVLTVGVPGIALHLGPGPWARKLSMVSEVLETFRGKGQRPGVVFLDNVMHPERVVVRLR